MVLTPCSSKPLPSQLACDVYGVDGFGPPGCSCLSGHYTLVYRSDLQQWEVTSQLCGTEFGVVFVLSCLVNPGSWAFGIEVSGGSGGYQTAPLQTNPVDATFVFVPVNPNVCNGTAVVHVYEIP